jgi:hypothetical protein
VSIEGCNKHPGVRAAYRCQQCSKPICEKCIINDRFCSDACNKKYSTFYQNYKKPVDTSRSPIWGFLFFVAVVAGLYFGAKHFGFLPWTPR